MKKYAWMTLALLFAVTLQAAPAILLRPDSLPGAANVKNPSTDEKVTLTAEYAAAGTCAFWIRPEGWDQSDNAWHFFFVAGKHSKDNPYVVMFRLPSGKVRMVWCKQDPKHEVTDIFADVPFRSGEWTHFALTWRDDDQGCVLRLYVNGKLISGRRISFQMEKSFPLNWVLGDTKRYTPYSKFRSTLGRIEFYKSALSADEIAALAAQKFVDGRMTFVSRKFVPGSVNRISGTCFGAPKQLEAVFVSESGKEEKKSLPFV